MDKKTKMNQLKQTEGEKTVQQEEIDFDPIINTNQ